ncbi:MAG: membrane dipeptidase [Bacteroidetes bacterium OLB11]|nr:MAG: membrane dipeptidase [Bacteroidetes bacterium OLB11]
MTKNDICTHTYAMKLIRDEAFIPGGEGLTTYAKNFIDLCYQNNGYNNKRTLIDIKHMGLSSRIQFYKYRSEKGYTNIPLVASHIAVTGLSFNNIYISGASKSKDYKDTIEVHHRPLNSVFSYSRDGAPKVDLSFNQWSLNLYDEEIIYIINSEGIMGLIMDSRVLGNSVDVNNKVIAEGVEYFSKESFNYLLNNNHFNKKAPKNYDKEIELEFKGIPYDGLIHLFANMMHIVMVYYKKYSNTEDKLKAWDHICIGSDFDGLISTIGGADDASYFNNLRKEFSKMISTIRKNSKMSQYFGALDSDVLVNKIFYSNGIRFLNKNL